MELARFGENRLELVSSHLTRVLLRAISCTVPVLESAMSPVELNPPEVVVIKLAVETPTDT
jgi:hypothetical protein